MPENHEGKGLLKEGPQKHPIVEHVRHEGFMGYTCYFCGKVMGSLPAVMLQSFKVLSDGSEYPIELSCPQAHIGCAKQNGLAEIGDCINVRR